VLVDVPPPEFVAPQAGEWIAEQHQRGGLRTWHRASGDLRPPRARHAWPSLVTLCGRELRAFWRPDGSPLVSIVRTTSPLERACHTCARRPVRGGMAA
jgi:hypothetical protein